MSAVNFVSDFLKIKKPNKFATNVIPACTKQINLKWCVQTYICQTFMVCLTYLKEGEAGCGDTGCGNGDRVGACKYETDIHHTMQYSHVLDRSSPHHAIVMY